MLDLADEHRGVLAQLGGGRRDRSTAWSAWESPARAGSVRTSRCDRARRPRCAPGRRHRRKSQPGALRMDDDRAASGRRSLGVPLKGKRRPSGSSVARKPSTQPEVTECVRWEPTVNGIETVENVAVKVQPGSGARLRDDSRSRERGPLERSRWLEHLRESRAPRRLSSRS